MHTKTRSRVLVLVAGLLLAGLAVLGVGAAMPDRIALAAPRPDEGVELQDTWNARDPHAPVAASECPPDTDCRVDDKPVGLGMDSAPAVPPETTVGQPHQPWRPLAPDSMLRHAGPGEGTSWEDALQMAASHQGAHLPAGLAPESSGGPDGFGYTWDDTAAFTWIDATAGTDTGLSQAPWGASLTTAIDLGFSFRFYENTYSKLYISTAGAVGFDGSSLGGHTGTDWVPSAATPNSFIAPYLAPLWVNSGNYTGRVYYLRGGSAPERYLVVEWHQVQDDINGRFTFEAILYENGNIAFSYQSMDHPSGYYCSTTAAIEDAAGNDGLAYRTVACNHMGSATGKTIRFVRPAASPRVQVLPKYQGGFTQKGASKTYRLTVRNNGEFGTDTFDLIPASSSWLTRLYAADGVTPLSDTDGDGVIDTGPVDQGSRVELVASVQAGSSAQAGNHSTTTITVRSSRDTNKSKTSTLQTAIPAPFAQVYRDNSDNAMSLYLAQPAGQATRKATAAPRYGDDLAVAETPTKGFVYAWRVGRCIDNACNIYAYEIEYALVSQTGNALRGATKLTDHSGATVRTYDSEPAVAVTPDGRIGVLWERYLYDQGASTYNFNLHFAVLDAAGNVLTPPISITNNAEWGAWDALSQPHFDSPRIAPTGNNRFVLAWTRSHRDTSGEVQNIYYAIISSGGTQIKTPTQLTGVTVSAGPADQPAGDVLFGLFDSPITPPSQQHSQPALASLSGNRVFLSWERREGGNDDVLFAVLGSDGGIVKGITDLSQDEGVTDWNNWDVTQLSDGKIVAVWEAWGCYPDEWRPRIRYAVLDSSFNRLVAPRCLGRAESALTGEGNVSVTADAAGRAIFTWMDRGGSERQNLYYALVDGGGNVVTPAMIFRTDTAVPPDIFTSYHGYGNAPYSWVPPAGVDGYITAAAAGAGSIGGFGRVTVSYGNNGAQVANSVLLETTLPSGLTYDSDTSGTTPSISGQRVRWSLPSLSLLSQAQFTLYVRVGAGIAAGTSVPITFSLASAGPEANPADNSAGMTLVAAPPPGGPDDYGYTWDDQAPFRWIDAKTGSKTSIAGDDRAGKVAIGFPFKFYDETYSEVFVSTNGILVFGQEQHGCCGPVRMPLPALPNRVVAPFWTDLAVGSPYNAGAIYTKSGGAAPNRYFVIQWDGATQCCSSDATDAKTFQVVLHENGDLVVQYRDMLGDRSRGSIGLEDRTGADGLQYPYQASSGRAILFTRPLAQARLRVFPLYQGQFSHRSAQNTFVVPVQNTGEIGPDVYNLSVVSNWPAQLFAADGVTLLTDSDRDGLPDTGPVTANSVYSITVKARAPGGAQIGDSNSTALTIRSSRDPARAKTAVLQSAVPAPFAQAYWDSAEGAMSLDLVRPEGRATTKAGPNLNGSNLAVAELPGGGFVYAWTVYRREGSVSVSEIEYALLDRAGNVVRAPGKLTNHSGTTRSTYDYPVIAVAPDGRIGIIWYRYVYDDSTGQYNYNVHFGVLDPAGNLLMAPINLTNNTNWGSWSDLNFAYFSSPRIAATSDNRFVLSWLREHRESAGYVDDIYFAVRDTGGSQVRPVTRLTSDTPGNEDGYTGPTMTNLSGNRILIACQRSGNVGDIYYTVLNSGGAVVKEWTNLVEDGANQWDWGPDAIQLSDGRIVIAWTGGSYPAYNIRFAVLDAGYQQIVGPTSLDNPAATVGNGYVSAAADPAGRGILTWMDYHSSYRPNLYYALIDGDGRVLTQPTIFRSGQATDPRIESSFEGYGNTSYLHYPPQAAHPVYLPMLVRQDAAGPTQPVLSPIAPPEANPSYTVAWSTAARADSYVLERAADASFGNAVQVYVGPLTQHTETSVGIMTYYYRVKARSASGDSGWSNVQTVGVRWELEPNESAAEANGPLASTPGYYGYPDTIQDYYYFDVQSAGQIRLEIANHSAQGGQLVLWYQSTALPENRKATCAAAPGCTLTYDGPAGRYYVQVYTVAGFSRNAPYTLRAVYP